MMRLPNSVESVDCYTWCSRYLGDKEPNTDGEILYYIGGVRRIQS